MEDLNLDWRKAKRKQQYMGNNEWAESLLWDASSCGTTDGLDTSSCGTTDGLDTNSCGTTDGLDASSCGTTDGLAHS